MKAVKNGVICGYVVWEDPNRRIIHPLEHVITRREYLKGADQVVLSAIQETNENLENTIKEKHGTLGGLAVDPDYQGLGIGGLLLDWGLKQADEQGLAVLCIASEEVSPITNWC